MTALSRAVECNYEEQLRPRLGTALRRGQHHDRDASSVSASLRVKDERGRAADWHMDLAAMPGSAAAPRHIMGL